MQRVDIDCGTGHAAAVDLTAAESAAFQADQQALAPVLAALQALQQFRQLHQQALAQVKPALTANSTQAAGDASTLPAIVTALAAGQALTAAQTQQLLRFIVRALIALGGA